MLLVLCAIWELENSTWKFGLLGISPDFQAEPSPWGGELGGEQSLCLASLSFPTAGAGGLCPTTAGAVEAAGAAPWPSPAQSLCLCQKLG